MTIENENALKHMYGKELLSEMGKALLLAYPQFKLKKFQNLEKELINLEMKPRVRLIRDALYELLPKKFPEALAILMQSIQMRKLGGFALWPYTEFIQEYGLEYKKQSLDALSEITLLFTSEWGVRPFIRLYPDYTLNYLLKKSKSKEVNIRRWVSEGSRPRLPWGEKLFNLIEHPKLTLPLLENLKFDSELFVRKSVANHLNDITKDHPNLVIQILKKWKKEVTKKDEDNLNWIIKHSLRSLIKGGHPGALSLIGVSTDIKIRVSDFHLKNKIINMNEKLGFSFFLESDSTQDQKIVIDYIIHFVKANAKTSPKVFKLKTVILKEQEKVFINKEHHIKQITTRVYYPGQHKIEIQINGKVLLSADWKLKF